MGFEMEMEHFSHKHPLSLIEVKKLELQLQKMKIDEGQDSICYGCLQSVSSEEFVYFCTEYKCKGSFFLHKSCAELPLEISHPNHEQHSLILYQRPVYQYGSCRCNVCERSEWEGFTYNCSICEFDVDILCVLRNDSLLSAILGVQTSITLKCHEHPLMLNPRPAPFFCNACGTEDRDESYLCTNTSCPFWIHKTCALLPETKESQHHNHPLSLAYSFPFEYRHFHGMMTCDICRKKIYLGSWVYHCARCRYFVHIKCVNAKTSGPISEQEEEHHGNFSIKLPGRDTFAVGNIFIELTGDFLKKCGLATQELLSEIKHFSHMHPMKEMEFKEALICDGCILPICDSYYSCEKCSYFLHPSCAQMPRELRHSSHPEHSLVLRKLKSSFSYFVCRFCELICNGFSYSCEVCQFHLDLKCAIVDTISVIIKHEAHSHQLVQMKTPNACQCNSCQEYIGEFAFFGCEECSFHLDYKCILLPGLINPFETFGVYKQDNHPLILMYPPFYEHPQEFYCEICEREMHPKFWIYHCLECDRSFHSRCIEELRKYRNIKFGATLQVLNHSHTVKFILRGGFTPFCECCDGDLHCKMAFECGDCEYYICYLCGIQSQDFGSSILKSSVDNRELTLADDSNLVSKDKIELENLINLPTRSLESMVEQFVKQHGFTGSGLAAEITHFSHKHPLNLSTNHPEDVKTLNEEEILICDGCVRRISDPYYLCKDCNYFLHARCAQLPHDIRLRIYQFKVLILSKPPTICRRCSFCALWCNGFMFKSNENKDIVVDIHCAILSSPNTLIKHEAHPHQLVAINVGGAFLCRACGDYIYRGALSCDDCGFYLHIGCALLSRLASNVKIHKHPLILSSYLASQHPKMIYCEQCKKKIYTVHWFYYCSECNQSFHPRCIPEFFDDMRNVKFGGLIQLLNHPHALKFVRKETREIFLCGSCRYRRFEKERYACEPCGYWICRSCAERMLEAPPVTDIVGQCSSSREGSL